MRSSMIRLGSVTVDPPLVLAPMAGITDHLYRLMLRRIGGVGLVTMEFISSEAITRGNARHRAKMFFQNGISI
jgi:tRNA-dihydrouridine synthase B